MSSDAVEALLSASRALVDIAARSVADIATELGVAPSTGTRRCDRLIRKGLIRRHRLSTDRRVVRLMLTAEGRRLVDRVMRRQRRELSAIVAATGDVWHPAVAPAYRAFAAAAGDVPEQDWWLGWPADGEVA